MARTMTLPEYIQTRKIEAMADIDRQGDAVRAAERAGKFPAAAKTATEWADIFAAEQVGSARP